MRHCRTQAGLKENDDWDREYLRLVVADFSTKTPAIYHRRPTSFDVAALPGESGFLICLYAELYLLKGRRHTRIRFLTFCTLF